MHSAPIDPITNIATTASDRNGKQIQATASLAKRGSILAYGIASYAIGFAGLVYVILACANIIPLGQLLPMELHPVFAIVINLALTCLFGLQHSIMARPAFKERFSHCFGAACERSTFIWSSGLVLFMVVSAWQPVGGTIWQAESFAAQAAIWSVFSFGWFYLFAATFAIDHFDLFGLRQVWAAARGKPYQEPVFKQSWMYKFSRHPIMLGALIGMWAVPTMTGSHLVFALTFTVYVIIGVGYEERDLIKNFGKTYLEYQKEVGMFFTLK